MLKAFIMYASSMTVTLFAVAVYCFTNGIPATGFTILLFSLLASCVTFSLLSRYFRERERRKMIYQMSRIEVVVVPSLLYQEGGVLYNIPYAKPVPSILHAQ